KEFSTDPNADFNNISKRGFYHVVVSNAEEEAKLILDFEVLGGQSDQLGKVLREWIEFSAAAQAYSFAVAAQLITQAEVEAAKKLRADVTFEPLKSKGRHLVIETDFDEYEGKTRVKVVYKGFYAIDDPNPQVQAVINKGMLQAAGDASENLFGDAGGSEGNDGAAAGQSKEGSSVKDDEFGDLF
ncbi:hypothetical protein LCGC14_2368840, partial [marine sediment metagenome]